MSISSHDITEVDTNRIASMIKIISDIERIGDHSKNIAELAEEVSTSKLTFTKKKEAKKGKLSAGLAAASFLLFITAVVLAYLLDNSFGFLVGGVGLFAPFFPYTDLLWDCSAFLKRAEAIKPALSVQSAMDCF